MNGDTTAVNEGANIRHGIEEDDIIAINALPMEAKMTCDLCNKEEALIFQNEGNFCITCWQDRTYPDVTPRNIESQKD